MNSNYSYEIKMSFLNRGRKVHCIVIKQKKVTFFYSIGGRRHRKFGEVSFTSFKISR